MPSKIKVIKDTAEKYSDYDYKKSIEDRLNKTLNLYINELDNTCERVLSKRRKDIVIKEFSK